MPPTNAWYWSARISTSPTTSGAASWRVSARRRRRTTASTRAISSSGWHGLVTHRRRPAGAHARAGPRWTGRAHDHPEPGASSTAARGTPRLRTESGQVDHDCVEPHGHDGVQGHRTGEHAVLPADPVQALGQDLEEPAVAVHDGQPYRGRALASPLRLVAGGVLRRCGRVRHRIASLDAIRDADANREGPVYGLFTGHPANGGQSCDVRYEPSAAQDHRRARPDQVDRGDQGGDAKPAVLPERSQRKQPADVPRQQPRGRDEHAERRPAGAGDPARALPRCGTAATAPSRSGAR